MTNKYPHLNRLLGNQHNLEISPENGKTYAIAVIYEEWDEVSVWEGERDLTPELKAEADDFIAGMNLQDGEAASWYPTEIP
jgi:hypothetical protein